MMGLSEIIIIVITIIVFVGAIIIISINKIPKKQIKKYIFCIECGKKIKSNASVCIYCGVSTK